MDCEIIISSIIRLAMIKICPTPFFPLYYILFIRQERQKILCQNFSRRKNTPCNDAHLKHTKKARSENQNFRISDFLIFLLSEFLPSPFFICSKRRTYRRKKMRLPHEGKTSARLPHFSSRPLINLPVKGRLFIKYI